MRTNQPSITAENNAALRALESMRPADKRICDDPYARHFISNTFHQAENTQQMIAERISAWEKIFPGVCNAILARTRFIDDCLDNAIKEGVQQMVIMGAGYDTRALRFKRLKKNVRIFELDHPATQAIKLERYKQSKLPIPNNVSFVPVDFSSEDISQKLVENGYRRLMRTFFIWEGVTYYISSDAIDKTLSFILNNAPEGSSVVFDYFPSSVVDGTSHLNEARALSVALKQLGEEFVFGLDPEKTKSFLKNRGFDLVINITAKNYKNLYFESPNLNRRVSDMFIFAHARVKQA
jgi:methyltransferase (TIGR00027 family)